MNWTTYIAECVGRDDLIAARDAACFVLGLSNMTPDAQINEAAERHHTSITLRADRMSGVPCIGDSRLPVATIADMDRETCRAEFPQVTDEQFAAVKAWLETDFGRVTMRACGQIDELRDQLEAVAAAKVRTEDRLLTRIRELTKERDSMTVRLGEVSNERDELRDLRDRNVADAIRAREERNIAFKERDEARRLHSAAVEELAHVKMGAITADQIELFIWRNGWGNVIKAAGDVSRFAAGLAEHLKGEP